MKLAAYALIPALAAAPALAGGPTYVAPDPVVVAPAPIVEVTPDWTGFYGGVQVGWGMLDASGARNATGDGVIGGAHLGYNWDFGTVVTGIELDYNLANIELSGNNGELTGLGRAKVRAGVDAGRTLIYLAGGAAYGVGSITGTAAENDFGYFGGAGIEFKVSDNVSAGVEALYHRFDDFDNTGVNLDATTIQARVSYRF